VAEAEQVRPTPFPTHIFIGVGSLWVLLDLVVMLFGWQAPLEHLLLTVWMGVLMAKFMLLMGWLFLGEGTRDQRLLGGLLFAPLLTPFLFKPEALGLFLVVVMVGSPVAAILCIPNLLLYASDCRLRRDTPVVNEPRKQFTVRQLMVVTLVAAMTMGLTRWTIAAELHDVILLLQIPLLGWMAPLALTFGLLSPRWYPCLLYAGGTSVYLLAQSWLAFNSGRNAQPMMFLFVSTYLLFFAAHVLLMRWLGFRLLRG
jgi:hypothetical protein